MTSKASHIAPLAWQIGTIAALLALWQCLRLLILRLILPRLENIAAGYVRLWHGDLLYSAIIPSLYRLAIGFAIAVIAGSVIGLALGYLRGLEPWTCRCWNICASYRQSPFFPRRFCCSGRPIRCEYSSSHWDPVFPRAAGRRLTAPAVST